MAGRLTHVGRVRLGQGLKGSAPDPSSQLRLILFTNDFDDTLDEPDTPDFTEATFGGYSEGEATYGETTFLGDVDGNPAFRIHGAPFSWTCSGSPQTITGWILQDLEDGVFLAYEKYATPHVLQVGSVHTLFVDIAVGPG